MARLIIIPLIASLGLGAFSIWGLFTEGGRQSFDEMDGMYPFFAGVAAVFFLGINGSMWCIHRWRSRRKRSHESS